MENKTIVKVVELGNGYQLVRFEDGDIAFIQVITPDGLEEEISDLMGGEPEETTKPEKKEKAKKEPEDTTAPEPEEEEEAEADDEYTWDDLAGLSRKKLEKLAEENDLDTEDFEEDETEELRAAIAEELGVEVPEEEEAEEAEEEAEAEEDDEAEEADDYTWDDLSEMDFDELSELCKENDTETDPGDFDEDEEDELRRAIAEEFDIDVPEKKKPRRKK